MQYPAGLFTVTAIVSTVVLYFKAGQLGDRIAEVGRPRRKLVWPAVSGALWALTLLVFRLESWIGLLIQIGLFVVIGMWGTRKDIGIEERMMEQRRTDLHRLATRYREGPQR
jgi:hypothetical protein